MNNRISNQRDIFDKAQPLNVKQLTANVLSKWYWVVLSVVSCLGIAHLVNRFTTPVYEVSTSLYVKNADDRSDIRSLLYSNQSPSGISKSLYNESVFLKSYLLIEKTLKDLRFNVTYFKEGKVRKVELYPSSPVRLSVDTASSQLPYYQLITCTIVDDKSFRLHTESKEWAAAFQGKRLAFGTPVNLQGFKFTMELLDSTEVSQEIQLLLADWDGLTMQYQSKLAVSAGEKESSILTLAATGTTPQKEIDFLNRLVRNFIQTDVEEKNAAANKTVDFIDMMLSQNKDSLHRIESRLEVFKSTNATVDLSVQGNNVYANIKELEKERTSLLAANRYFSYLESSLHQNKTDEQIVLPSMMGVQDAFVDNTITAIVSLQLENKLLKSDKNLKNPFLEENSRKIEDLKNTLLQKVKSLKAANALSLQDIDQQVNSYLASQRQLPSAERELGDIQRVYGISESLVQFLMEKRAEAGITRASNSPDYKIVDVARQVGGAIQPRPQKNYLTGLMVGLTIPVLLILVISLFNNKVIMKEDILQNTSLPVLGMIVHSQGSDDLAVAGLQRSASSESFRSLRSNLSYMLDDNGASQVLLITSAISGEGKSYCAKNLAYVLSLAGKRTLLVNGDMRKLGRDANSKLSNVKGLSSYLSGNATLSDITFQTDLANFHLIESGAIPPNPSELLLGEKMTHLLTTARKSFDYIIIDTSPVGLVSDATALFKYVDLTLFVVRQRYSEKAFLNDLEDLRENFKEGKMAIVFNDVDMKKAGYGSYGVGGKGYGYSEQPRKKWWSLHQIAKSG